MKKYKWHQVQDKIVILHTKKEGNLSNYTLIFSHYLVKKNRINTLVLQAWVFWKTTQIDIIIQCATHTGPINLGYFEANKLKAIIHIEKKKLIVVFTKKIIIFNNKLPITLAVIELRCHKNCRILPVAFKLFFSASEYLKLRW